MTLFPVLVDVYHKEQLLTREEAEKIEYCRWEDIVITKDDVAATRIAEILDKYGFNVAQRLRGNCVFPRLCVQIPYGILKRHNYLRYWLYAASLSMCVYVHQSLYLITCVVNVCFKYHVYL